MMDLKLKTHKKRVGTWTWHRHRSTPDCRPLIVDYNLFFSLLSFFIFFYFLQHVIVHFFLSKSSFVFSIKVSFGFCQSLVVLPPSVFLPFGSSFNNLLIN